MSEGTAYAFVDATGLHVEVADGYTETVRNEAEVVGSNGKYTVNGDMTFDLTDVENPSIKFRDRNRNVDITMDLDVYASSSTTIDDIKKWLEDKAKPTGGKKKRKLRKTRKLKRRTTRKRSSTRKH